MHPRQNRDSSNAQEDAMRILKNAQEDATRLLKNAQEDAARLVKNAQEDATRLLKNAQEDAARLVKNAQDTYESNEEPPKQNETTLKKDKMSTIGELSSRLAHDLQNPLTIIKNTLEILKLKQPDADKKTKENYERIDRAVSRMSQSIRDVLDYVRTSSPLMEKTSILRLLETVVGDLQVPQSIKIILPTDDVYIFGDVKQFEIVFSNLILNSIQAIGENGKIMIQASEIDDSIVIDVIDNGRGIEKDNLPKIFEPLFTTKQDGTGLGLASCKSIIDTHGGAIECASIVGKGTVFTIKIPKFSP